jgi:hypothetical protein
MQMMKPWEWLGGSSTVTPQAFASGQVEDLGLFQVEQEPGVAVVADGQ